VCTDHGTDLVRWGCQRKRTPTVYVLCEPASHYYEIMTRSKWAPVLIGERI
jgi:hypothetical protein